MLALRYLNPIRTHVSVITLISLAGVAIGVMVLVVVLSVMDGFENLIKERVLGRAPHITSYVQSWYNPELPDGGEYPIEDQWRDHMEKLGQHSSVKHASPLVQDHVLLEMSDGIMLSSMQGIDTGNSTTMEDFNQLLKKEDGSEPMGEGYYATISSIYQEKMGLKVGDKVEIISSRTLKQIKPLLDEQEYTPLRDQVPDELKMMILDLAEYIKTVNNQDGELREMMFNSDAQKLKETINVWKFAEIRTGERAMLTELTDEVLNSNEYDVDDPEEKNFYPVGTKEVAVNLLKELQVINVDRLDKDTINNVALPKDVVISGVYQTDPFAPGPDIFTPLLLAQELTGVGETGYVAAIEVMLHDPYKAKEVLEDDLSEIITDNWKGETWMAQHEQQFALIRSQKTMMTVALSFIVLIAVFSIGAVMFTITYQKKREIGVMKALGATPGQITGVFTLQGVIVGILGAAIGLGLAHLVLWKLGWIQAAIAAAGFDPFPKDFYGVDTLPHIINGVQNLWVCIGAFILCTFAALVPAWIASRADAAKSLRNM